VAQRKSKLEKTMKPTIHRAYLLAISTICVVDSATARGGGSLS
jgi:hypothetical protein